MDFSSPPMALPRSDFVPASPSINVKKTAIYISDSDDEIDEPVTHVPESSPYFTQPTQIVNRTTLQPAPSRFTSSSPKAEIEVPVSSPIPPRKLPMTVSGGRLATAMAPAGTMFRAPRVEQKSIPPKRKLEESDDELDEPVYVVDSSDDDDGPTRGDIRPSSFKPRQTTPPHASKYNQEKQALPDRTVQLKVSSVRVQQLAKKVRAKVGNSYSMDDCTKALQKNGLNTDAAVASLRSNPPARQAMAQPSILKAFARAGSDAARNSSASTSPISSQGSSRSASSSRTSQGPPTPSPQPVKSRGRLQRGLKPRAEPSSSQVEIVQPTRRTQLIDLVSEDEVDNETYSSEPEPSSPTSRVSLDSGSYSRILEYLENCTVENLMAITKMKAAEKERAAAMVKHRPYHSLEQARAVVLWSGKAKGKRSKIAVGEVIVDKLIQFVETLDAIDQVVTLCEKKGAKIDATLNRWKIERSGAEKSSSAKSAFEDLPFPSEPKPMQGKCTLQPYQLFGMNWLWQLYSQQFGCILADDMGLGKTCQVVAFVSLLVENYKSGIVKGDKPWPVLIVVPPTTLANWEAEFNKFSSGLNLIIYSGSQPERDELAYEIREDPKAYHVVLTSYSQLNRIEDIVAMKRIKPHVAVFDEAHKLKNPTARIYKQLIRIDADWKLFLTGTPVQNNIMEMVALLNFINPDLFQDHMEALEDLFIHRASLQEVSQGAVLQSDRVHRARTILEPFILQRKKENVLTTLPEKTRRVVYCDLLDSQKSVYQEYEGNYRREVRRAIGRLNGRSDDQNNPWMQLRKAAIHGQLFRRFFTDKKVEAMAKVLMTHVPQSRLMQDDMGKLIQELKGESDFKLHLWCRDEPCIAKFDVPEASWMESGKVKKLLELIREFKKNGDRVLVFSKFVMVLEILEECLASANVDYRILKGDTKVTDRQFIIDEFNDDPSIPVFLLTTGAGGTGINLTSANKVIVFDQSDNPQDDIQAENRAHRFGQTREVEIIRLLTKGTIEELVHKACQRKLELAGQITGHAEDISAKTIEADVRAMLAQEDAGEIV